MEAVRSGERERIRLVSAPVQRWSPSGKGRSVYGEFRCQHVECWAQQQVEIELLESTKSLLLGGQACYWDLLLLALRYSTAAVSSAAMIQAQCQGGDGPVGDRVCCRSSTLREKEFEFVESRNVFFFSCIAERARGMVGQLSRYAKAKKGWNWNYLQESFTGLESKTGPKTNNTNKTANKKQTETRKEPVKILAKRVKRFAPPKPLISSLPPYSVSTLPSMWMIRCPSCPLLHLPAQAGLSHQARVVTVWAGMCPPLFATALHSNPCMYQSPHEHHHPCPGMHVWSHWCPGPAAHVGVCNTTSTVDFAPTSPELLCGLVHGMLSLHRGFSGCPFFFPALPSEHET